MVWEEKALGFFDFVPALPSSSVIDVYPFLVAKEVQKAPCRLSDIHVPWDWNEDVWVDRLMGCISTTRIHPVKVFLAFTWSSRNYEHKISQIVAPLRIAPFHGMTDILICGKERVVYLKTLAVWRLTPRPSMSQLAI